MSAAAGEHGKKITIGTPSSRAIRLTLYSCCIGRQVCGPSRTKTTPQRNSLCIHLAKEQAWHHRHRYATTMRMALTGPSASGRRARGPAGGDLGQNAGAV